MSNLVTTAWLATHLGSPDIAIIDASWHLPTAKRNAREEYLARHIPGAQFYDLDLGADPTTTLPHMLPTTEHFAADMSALGVRKTQTVVCYDTVGLFSAARLWWMLKTFGHDRASVLDGGLPKWIQEGRPLETGLRPAKKGNFIAKIKPSNVATMTDVAVALRTQSAQIADARSSTRFHGEEPEPRPGVKAGHMPGARNLHYASLLTTEGTLKSKPELLVAFETAGIDIQKPIITSCGSGVTAAILSLALAELGVSHSQLYDGSWAEWGASTQEIATGSD